MGHGSYSYDSRMTRARSLGYDTKSTREIFTSTSLNNNMNPKGVTLREARDSDDHPESIPIVIALDETGSMGKIPHFLVRDGLPNMMQKIIDNGVSSPQVLFLGIGDHECDRAPLQVGQFEASDELLDKWLTDLYLEGNGGANAGESYLLAWFFASRYTETDHLAKRGKKGILFTIGDEPTLMNLSAGAQRNIMGEGQYQDHSAAELLADAREKYEVFHLHILEGSAGMRSRDSWKQLMGDNVIFIQHKEDVAQTIANIVLRVVAAQKEKGPQLLTENPTVENDSSDKSEEEEMML